MTARCVRSTDFTDSRLHIAIARSAGWKSVALTTAVTNDSSLKEKKLSGENYFHCKFQIEMKLIGKGLWDIMDGDEALPDGANDDQRRIFNK